MSVIDEIKQRLDIVDLIASYTRLQRAGRNFRALCPFHSEKVPSFVVYPESQGWHCFGACSTGGDIFAFVMRRENLDFAAALRLLAERAGVALEESRPKEEQDANERLNHANEAAALLYHDSLLNSPEASAARAYLEKRGLQRRTWEDWMLGFAPAAGGALIRRLRDQGFSDEELAHAGLAIETQSGMQDRFRGRITFPIRDVRGRTAGFGARALGDVQPKYLNTSQNTIFDKGGLLYGLDRARDAIRKQNLAVVVEGYMDVLTAHQAGLCNIIASMGTALSERQVRAIKRYSRNLAFALDADAAGQQATVRDVEVATRALSDQVTPVPTWQGLIEYRRTLGAEVKVIAMPNGRDPDDVIREDPGTWQHLVDSAQPVLDYLFAAAAAQHDLTKPEGKSGLVDQLLPAIASVHDPIHQAHYLQRLARLVQVEQGVLQSRLRKAGQERGRRQRPAAVEPEASPVVPAKDALEDYYLALLLGDRDLTEESRLSPEDFERTENRELYRVLLGGQDLTDAGGELVAYAELLREYALPPFDRKQRLDAVRECARRLRERKLRRLGGALQALLQELESEGGAARLAAQTFQGWKDGCAPEDDECSRRYAELRQQEMAINAELKMIFSSAMRRAADTGHQRSKG